MADRDEPFLSRWSRLKRESAKGEARTDPAHSDAKEPAKGAPQTATEAESEQNSIAKRPAEPSSESGRQAVVDFEKIDLESLDSASDFRPFLGKDVPEEIRRKALNKLWLSDPILSGPDQLSDYMDDFTDAACAVPAGKLRTAYKVGQGFLSDEEAAEWDRLGKDTAPPPSAPPEVTIAAETPDQPEIAEFLAASDAYAQSLYPPESNHLVGMDDLKSPNAIFLVARRAARALGCAALIATDEGWGEIKRMWVDPEARGQGIGRRLLEAIEEAARGRSLSHLRLETGIRQAEAIKLYSKFGFTECGPFGSYQPDPLSVFMEKRLG